MSLVVLSAFLHYIPIGILVRSSQPAFIGYAAVISCSTTLSVVWHYLEEPGGAIQYADYAMATVWSLYALYLMHDSHVIPCVFLEVCVGAANLLISLGSQYQLFDYKIWHTLWHILSAIKSMYIAWLLTYKNNQYSASYT
jgi:hypothetical protein